MSRMTLPWGGPKCRHLAAVSAALVLMTACGDDGSSGLEAGIADEPSGGLPGDTTAEEIGEEDFERPAPSGSPEPLDRSACEIFPREDIEGMTKYPGITFVIVDEVEEPPDPDSVLHVNSSRCAYNVETRYGDGGTGGGSGIWADVTLSNDLRAFSPNPDWPEYEPASGVGDDAYWTNGGWTLVVLYGDHVVKIDSTVSLPLEQFPDVIEGRRQMALDLAETVLPRV